MAIQFNNNPSKQISSRLNYCNSRLCSQKKFFGNSTVSRPDRDHCQGPDINKKSEFITPIIKSLHWLQVTHRVNFKSLLLVYKYVHGSGLKHISETLVAVRSSERDLGLTDWLFLTSGQNIDIYAAFCCYATENWCNLSADIRQGQTDVETANISILQSVFQFRHISDARKLCLFSHSSISPDAQRKITVKQHQISPKCQMCVFTSKESKSTLSF